MTPSALLEVTRAPHTATVTLNRPEVRNAFNDALIAQLAATFADLSTDTSLRCIVLAAHGKAFCAGADLNWMRAMADYSWEQNRADAQQLADMLWTLYQSPGPWWAGCRATAMRAAWVWRRCATCWWPATT